MNISNKYINPNPKLKANILNKLFFWWLKPLFFHQKDKKFDLQDLYNVLPENSSNFLGNELECSWNQELKNSAKNKKPSLLKASWKAFGSSFGFYGIHVFVICVILRGLQPYIIGRFIWHFEARARSTIAQASIYASVLIIMIVLQAIIGHHSVVGRKVTGMKISIAYSALIYRKILKLSLSASNKYNTGKVINLLSNDVAKFEDVCMFLHYIWVLPVQGIIMAYFMWDNVGIASLSGILFLTIQTLPIQGYLAKITAKIRAEVASKTDDRVRLMSEIVNGIRVIKMYTWEKFFENLIFNARRKEVDAIAMKSYLRGISVATSSFAESTSMFFVIMTYVLLGNVLEASVVYTVSQYFGLIKTMITVFYPRAISSVAEARVSIKRIEDFLLLEEIKVKTQSKNDVDTGIIIKNLKIHWNNNVSKLALFDVNLNISAKNLHAVTGPVGSGKSTLLKVILGELEPNFGDVRVNGKVSYASQESWLFPGTVQNNILFGQPFNQQKYNKVISVCALKDDLEKLPNGDLTFVGDHGSILSGGQCARINLARAVYRDADIYLIDDVLAAVDVHVGKHLFDNCINGYLKDKIRILITHNVQYFNKVDEIIIVNNGQIDFCGSYLELKERNYSMPVLPLQISNTDKSPIKNAELGPNNLELTFLENTSMKTKKNGRELVTNIHKIKSVYWKYFTTGGSIFILFCLVISLLLAQASISGCDYWLAHWIKREENRIKTSLNNNNSDYFELSTTLYIFSILVLVSIIMWTASSLLFYKVCMNASKNLHNQMVSNLLRAPLYFFEINPSGRILNRFSKDTGLVDETLPTVTLDALHVLLMIFGVAIQILIIKWWSIFPMIVMYIICWKFKNIYLPTAQNFRRLESKAKSPVFSYVNATLSGLTTIRSADVQNKIMVEFDILQDIHTSAHYINIISSSAFGFWLDIVSVSLLGLISFSFIFVRDNDTFAGIVGLAVTQILMLYGTVQYGLRQTTEMINQMISVERIFQFINLEQEGPFETEFDKLVSKNWPNKGKIEFHNLFLKYSSNKESALKNITLNIKPKEKIGIVGRTGAGKTSLINALFQLVDSEGLLCIDNIDIKTVGLHNLRKKISIIPQDPILFTTSVRNNLDPLHTCNDEKLWKALKYVELKNHFDNLNCTIECKGNNLSRGQKQLLCLARALITNNKILIFDEATANVDGVTDKIIQNTVKNRFLDCTVLTIAHRLNTVLDSDKILVMDQGKVVEFDSPAALMKQKNGYLYNMINT